MSRSTFRTLGWAGAVVATAACASAPGGGPGGVRLELDAPAYAPGDTARVTLVNPGPDSLYFAALCDLAVEGAADSVWVPVWEPDCSAMRVRPALVPPGEEGHAVLPMDFCTPEAAALHGGFRARVRYQTTAGEPGFVVSPPFALTGPEGDMPKK